MKKQNQDKAQLVRIIRWIAVFVLLLAIFRGVFILGLLILASFSMSFVINNLNLRQFGFELVTLVAVLSGMKYGPLPALIISFILITYHMLAGGFFASYLLWVIPAWSIAGLVAGFFPAADISQLGIYITLGINANNVVWTGITSPGYLPKFMVFVVTNIVFNFIIFSVLAKPLLLLMI